MSFRLSRRQFLSMGLLSTIGAVCAGGAYVTRVEPGWVEVVHRTLILRSLAPAFSGYKLIQLSDIHMGSGMTKERLQSIVDLVNEQQPDAVAITGDFVTDGAIKSLVPSLVQPLSRIKAKDLAVATLGNHDHWTDAKIIRQVIHLSGFVDLSNSVCTIQRGDDMLHLAGVDDYWERQDRLETVLKALPPEGAAILLAHEPDYADISATTGRFDLQISGHSHGGQVQLPILNRPIKLPPYGRKYPVGEYRVGNMIQYTNRGVGTARPAVRFNCRPEITVFTLNAPVN